MSHPERRQAKASDRTQVDSTEAFNSRDGGRPATNELQLGGRASGHLKARMMIDAKKLQKEAHCPVVKTSAGLRSPIGTAAQCVPAKDRQREGEKSWDGCLFTTHLS